MGEGDLSHADCSPPLKRERPFQAIGGGGGDAPEQWECGSMGERGSQRGRRGDLLALTETF